MTAHLLTITIGPIQDFINAARRSRDLWFGSFMLSEISKATACAVREARGKLIFPASKALNKSVANIILAELPDGIEPDKVAIAAEEAAKGCWKSFVGDAYKAAEKLIAPSRWNEQLEDDVLEFYAAWVPLDPAKYQETRQHLMRLLAGRKACRDFRAFQGYQGIPKSSLDGARESVLVDAKRLREILKQNDSLAQRFRFARGEQLDIIGVTKRAASGKPFASVIRVAADPWIRGIQKEERTSQLLNKITAQCKESSFATGTGDNYKAIFPYDGAVLYPSRLASLMRARQDKSDSSYAYEAMLNDHDTEALKEIKHRLTKLQKSSSDELGYGEPEPYLAILVADGDRMGKVLSAIESAERHCEFSQQLANFAEEAEAIVQSHSGCLVYSGGDDVLALLPVDLCLACARNLHDRFGQLLSTWQDTDGKKPTLSVGLAIGHCLEHLEDLLNYARTAEKAAKHPDRNGLAVHLHPRSGSPVTVRDRWLEDAGKENADRKDLCGRLEYWAAMHLMEKISDKAAYDLRQLARDYAGWPNSKETDEIIIKDVVRLLSRKRIEISEFADPEELRNYLQAYFHPLVGTDPIPHKHYHPGVMQLAKEWLIARRLARAMRQAQGKNTTSKETSS